DVRTWRRGGLVQHHLIDPATGRPARTPWRDVTVAAQDCVAADIAAKAALLLGVRGPSWLERLRPPGRPRGGRRAGPLTRGRRGAAGGGTGRGRGVSPAVWYVARASGIIAYLLLSGSVIVGTLMSARARFTWPRFAGDPWFAGIVASSICAVLLAFALRAREAL